MASSGDGKGCDFYGVLGLDKECTPQELRNAYKRLALRWHPDRCLGNPRSVEEAKKNFQGIQEAYSVLSDSNKRFSYDIGMYQNDTGYDDDMGEFLSEMASMMNQTKPCENGEDSFKQLQDLYDELFHNGIDDLANSSPFNFKSKSSSCSSSSPSSFSSSSSFNNYGDNSHSTRKRHSADYAHDGVNISNAQFQNIHFRSGIASSGSSSFNGRKIKRRNSGSNIH